MVARFGSCIRPADISCHPAPSTTGTEVQDQKLLQMRELRSCRLPPPPLPEFVQILRLHPITFALAACPSKATASTRKCELVPPCALRFFAEAICKKPNVKLNRNMRDVAQIARSSKPQPVRWPLEHCMHRSKPLQTRCCKASSDQPYRAQTHTHTH